MLIGFVSDERYLALPDVAVEFERAGESVAVVRSSPRGAIHAELPAGRYRVTLAREGFGSKSVVVDLPTAEPYPFRLLSNGLLGYAWPKWVRAGERSEFRVHAVEPYRLELWRYGLRKEPVRLLGWYDEHGPRATMQITPDGDYTRTGVAWNRTGYGSLHHTQLVEAPDRSGLYYFHARGESGDFFAFPWVVAPRAPGAPLAVLASTNTWNAYNNFGGRSNYVNSTALPEQPIVNARLDMLRYADGSFNEWHFDDASYAPLSFDRPEPVNHVPEDVQATDPIEGRSACHLAPAEWRLLAWLERERIDYDLFSDGQLHSGVLPLESYRALAVSTHPEYWSVEMFQRVKQWVLEDGGRLLYLGGNGINCAVELPDETTMRCRTQLLSENGSLGMHDPREPNVWYESRFHRVAGVSEASLLGVVCTAPGIMTAAPYRVCDASHWAFEGTGLHDGELFGEASQHERCHGGASGHETDKMGPSTPAGTTLLARGTNPDGGGAEMICLERPGGGKVFSVGSINYPSSLLVDEHVSRVTANVVRRFLA